MTRTRCFEISPWFAPFGRCGWLSAPFGRCGWLSDPFGRCGWLSAPFGRCCPLCIRFYVIYNRGSYLQRDDEVDGMARTNFERLEVYRLSEELADAVWDLVVPWDRFAKDTVGKQLVRAADSIGANIAEGYARFHFRDRVKFYYNARGSLAETTTHWLALLNERGLADDETVEPFVEVSEKLSLKLNTTGILMLRL